MINDKKILIVDDHPMIASGYELFLKEETKNYNFDIDKAVTIDEALELVEKSKNNPYDLVLLDIRLPSSKDNNILNGEELGLRILKIIPSIKIIVLTSLNDIHRIYLIWKNLKPLGFLIKSEVTPESLIKAVHSVLKNKVFFSEDVNKVIDLNLSDREQIDRLDQQILYYISIGEKMKNLPNYVPLSMPSIERRKRRIKTLLNLSESNDRQLLDEAKKRGYI